MGDGRMIVRMVMRGSGDYIGRIEMAYLPVPGTRIIWAARGSVPAGSPYRVVSSTHYIKGMGRDADGAVRPNEVAGGEIEVEPIHLVPGWGDIP